MAKRSERETAIRKEIRELKAEMKAEGIRVLGFMNRQPSMRAARCNERLYALKLDLERAVKESQPAE